MLRARHLLPFLAVLAVISSTARESTNAPTAEWWSLQPVQRPVVPRVSPAPNPIDQFIAAEQQAHGLRPVGPARKRALLRRVYLDLIGLPPSPEEQDRFLKDDSPTAYESVVDRLLGSDQHAVRYARHWLDVLRYSDTDERMTAAPGIYLWRDWVIRALQENLPYDAFVRAQLTGYRTSERTQMSATGYRSKKEPRPEDLFALGFLARGSGEPQELAISAVETVSTAFMGMTVGCAKCHDHMYDPISQDDFYGMKALFDPLVLRKVTLATAAELFTAGQAQGESDRKRAPLEMEIERVAGPYKKKLYEDRVVMLPPDIQTIIRKSEKDRTAGEQKIADDYFPILRIDSEKIVEIMPEAERKRYQELQKELGALTGPKRGRRSSGLPVFYTVEVDHAREAEKAYILTSGDPARPEKNHEVKPGWPFAPSKIDVREGRIEAFSDWLTSKENPLFARVAVNRLWQWHFGEGLQKTPSDFGELGGKPTHPALLDWLASEFVASGFDMRKIHKLIVTSQTYQMATEAAADVAAFNEKIDSANAYLWHFRLQRLEAEPIWDSIQSAAGNLDLNVGGPSFDPREKGDVKTDKVKRAAFMIRGYSTSRDVLPPFLETFDVDDGRAACPVRTKTVTSPQALFVMNSPEVDQACARFSERLKAESNGELGKALDLAYELTLGRQPSAGEKNKALNYLRDKPEPLKKLAWLLYNLDEFLYVP